MPVNNPGLVAKKHCFFDGTVAGVNPPAGGVGFSTIERVSAGRYIATFSSNMPDFTYPMIITPCDSRAIQSNVVLRIIVKTIGWVEFIVGTPGGASDIDQISIVIF